MGTEGSTEARDTGRTGRAGRYGGVGYRAPVLEAELAFAHELADAAGEIAMSFFRGTFEVRHKADRTPVTEADLAIEAMIRDRVHERFPDDGVLGEEGGLDARGARRWVVDPIDGTRNFADGVQIWANLIALAIDRPVVGVVNAPALGERYAAAAGLGATLNAEAIEVSRADRIGRSFVCFGEIDELLSGPQAAPVLEILREARRSRGFGDFWGHMLVARGSVDVMLEPALATWDVAALQVVVEEAGGRMTTFDGGPLEHGSSVLTTNALLHDELVARLSTDDAV
jgi:histidinol-phosphatase